MESLARTAIGEITIIDLDDICVSNINRQVHATLDTVGMFKVDVMRERVSSISKCCRVNVVRDFIDENNIDEVRAKC